MLNKLSKSEQTCLALEALYESYGYKKYAMRKFEEYSLYLENKNFLTSEYILTFNDPSGKLMALKPDVTLSILKNAKNNTGVEKTFYREKVYRLDKQSRQYREIEQIGLEVLNSTGRVTEAEICQLACKSLAEIDPEFILCISNMEFISAILDNLTNASQQTKAKIVSFISSKNAHELYDALVDCGCEREYAENLSKLIMFSGSNAEVLELAGRLAYNDRMKEALESLSRLSILRGYADRVKIDFTLMNDGAYYNGLVFCGYVKRIPKAVLTGGYYNKMAQKFGKKEGGAGFALILGELNAYYEEKDEYDIDILLIYSKDSDPETVLEKAQELRDKGMSVRVESSVPERVRYKELIAL